VYTLHHVSLGKTDQAVSWWQPDKTEMFSSGHAYRSSKPPMRGVPPLERQLLPLPCGGPLAATPTRKGRRPQGSVRATV
jgi:hypothetical protein